VLSTCQRNIMLPTNRISDQQDIQWSLLDWRDALPLADARDELIERVRNINPTVVFGADLVYDLSILPALASLLSVLVTRLPQAPKIILAVTVRRQETLETFLEITRTAGLDTVVEDLPSLSRTVFRINQSDVDKEAVIKLVRVLKAENRGIEDSTARNTS